MSTPEALVAAELAEGHLAVEIVAALRTAGYLTEPYLPDHRIVDVYRWNLLRNTTCWTTAVCQCGKEFRSNTDRAGAISSARRHVKRKGGVA